MQKYSQLISETFQVSSLQFRQNQNTALGPGMARLDLSAREGAC